MALREAGRRPRRCAAAWSRRRRSAHRGRLGRKERERSLAAHAAADVRIGSSEPRRSDRSSQCAAGARVGKDHREGVRQADDADAARRAAAPRYRLPVPPGAFTSVARKARPLGRQRTTPRQINPETSWPHHKPDPRDPEPYQQRAVGRTPSATGGTRLKKRRAAEGPPFKICRAVWSTLQLTAL